MSRPGPAGRRRRSGELPGQVSRLPGCLDARDRAVLDFARDHHLQRRVGERVTAVLGVSEVRYLQLLAGLLDRMEAADAEPELIAALRATRDRGTRLAPRTGAPTRPSRARP